MNYSITIIQKQQYCVGILTVWICVNVYSYWYYLILSLAVQNAFSISLSTFHWLISVGFVLQCFLVHWPSLTSTLKPGLCPFLPCILSTLIHHACPFPCIYFIYASVPKPRTQDPLEDEELKVQHHLINAIIMELLQYAPYLFHQKEVGTRLVVQMK